MSEKPIFIQTEDGLGDIECARFPLAGKYSDVLETIAVLYQEKHDYKTAVVDSGDWMERLILAQVAQTQLVNNVEEIGYGKGYIFALDLWRDFLAGLDALRRERGMAIIILAHSKIEKFENPETDNYDRYSPRIHKLASALVQEWADEVLFATYRVHTKVKDEGFDKKTTKGIGSGERIIYTVERPAYVAKNRLSMPDSIPLDWRKYAEHFPTAPTAATSTRKATKTGEKT